MLQIKTYMPTNHKIKALIYGDSWSGKTMFGWTAPNVIFGSAEAGLLSIANKRVSYAEIKSVQDLREFLKFLKTEHKFETVVLDSISEINDIIKAEIERKKWKPMSLPDWGVLAKQIETILRAFRWLDMNVIMIAQEKIIDDDGKIHKIIPDLNGKTATNIVRFMDIVGHMEILWDWSHIINTWSEKHLVTKDRTKMLWTNTIPDFTKWLEALEDMEIVEVEEIIEELDMEKTEKSEEEIIQKEKTEKIDKLFWSIYEEIKMTANKTSLDLILSNLRKQLEEDPKLFTVEQKNEIKSLKEDMEKSFESKEKEVKPKTTPKKPTTKKVQTK